LKFLNICWSIDQASLKSKSYNQQGNPDDIISLVHKIEAVLPKLKVRVNSQRLEKLLAASIHTILREEQRRLEQKKSDFIDRVNERFVLANEKYQLMVKFFQKREELKTVNSAKSKRYLKKLLKQI
jgi:hypothetical protein